MIWRLSVAPPFRTPFPRHVLLGLSLPILFGRWRLLREDVSMLAMCHLGACWISAVAWTIHGSASAFVLHLLLELILNILVTDYKPDVSPPLNLFGRMHRRRSSDGTAR